jgi:hypothetical protein
VTLLNRVITLTDHTRLSEETAKHPEWYKEWYHFCIIGPHIEAVVNFSILRDNRSGVPNGSRQARVILLVHENNWDGEVIDIPTRDVRINPGRIDLHFGHHHMFFREGVFNLSLALETRPITLDLKIEPLTYPLLRSRATIGPGAIDWLVVPRMQASGTIICDQRVHHLVNVPAYHDHNWGHWLWGQDFAWEWGFALPTSGTDMWSLVFDCMTNRARSQTQELKLCLWKGDRLVRIFAHRDIQVVPQGYLKRQKVPKFPPIMKLIAPEMTTDVPRRLDIEANTGKDHLTCHFEAEDVAQIIIPNETDLGETVINEVTGTMEAWGNVKGDTVEIKGKGFFEFLT